MGFSEHVRSLVLKVSPFFGPKDRKNGSSISCAEKQRLVARIKVTKIKQKFGGLILIIEISKMNNRVKVNEV